MIQDLKDSQLLDFQEFDFHLRVTLGCCQFGKRALMRRRFFPVFQADFLCQSFFWLTEVKEMNKAGASLQVVEETQSLEQWLKCYNSAIPMKQLRRHKPVPESPVELV